MRTLVDFNDDERRDFYRDIVKTWVNGGNGATLAQKWGVKPYVVSGLANKLRKQGIPIPKRHRHFLLTPEFSAELTQIVRNA